MIISLLLATPLALAPVETVHGRTVDGWTQVPLAGVVLRDQEGLPVATSDAEGRFAGSVLAGMPGLWAEAPGGRHERTAVVLPRDGAGRLLRAELHISLLPLQPVGPPAADAFGLPPERHAPAAAVDELPLGTSLWAYTLPVQMPATIRVLRCPGTTCCSAPGDGVETMAFEDYVKGVVNAEVGVFRSMSTLDGQSLDTAARESGSAEVFKTLAVGSRSYALNWYLRRQSNNPGYDIRDGTCEQVYDDERHAWVNAAVDATAGEVLALGGGTSIDSFEYASSCKRLGSLPYGVSSTAPACGDVVADVTGVVGCVGTWCGDDTEDMGHQTHPCDPGRCRCLVRGICQWGAAERSFAGQDYGTILEHYQPNLVLLDMGAGSSDAGSTPATGKLVGYVREGDIYNTQAPISSATVQLDVGPGTQTSSTGYYAFEGLQAGLTVTVTASALGYSSSSETKYLDPAFSTWWKSLALAANGDAGAASDGAVADAAVGMDQVAGVDSAQATGDAAVLKGAASNGGCDCRASARASALGTLGLVALLTLRRCARSGRSRSN
jgi:hypothetical protein